VSAAIVIILVTLPLSVPVLMIPMGDAPFVFLGLLVGVGLVQAYGLYLLQLRRRRQRASTA
jgi:hypothetical protein